MQMVDILSNQYWDKLQGITNPNNALSIFFGEILQVYHTFLMFLSPQLGNFSWPNLTTNLKIDHRPTWTIINFSAPGDVPKPTPEIPGTFARHIHAGPAPKKVPFS